MSPIDAANVSPETKIKPRRTGTCQMTDNIVVLTRTTRFSSNDTITADRKAESSHKAGGHGLVNTIFRLRLRRCDEIMNRPRPAQRTSRNPLSSEKMSCKALKL